ncbi:hypothetical protein DMB95_03130 [Campylobacter sp. MIT 12-8780]|uniref:hypothetical protein n=1 Tax=unclassified Campylobacter TaxID=2593542 RepID=UPI00115F1D34|nr:MULTISPECIES: hypothetical protein [unclassified Campylobacter]NDJ26942.1 hypothetical protein [Campylobacter sp. MIT 19-121]TQR41917.1 hypothetical protein DMB95_03130 [Campylobacter sp. MIT 12-8780]
MNSIFSNDTNALFGYESLLDRMQKSLQTIDNTSFSDYVKNSSLSNVLSKDLSTNENIGFGLGDFTIAYSKQEAFLNIVNRGVERTSITASSLLSQTQTNLPQNAYKVEFDSIEKEQFEAIANTLKADEKLLEQNNSLGLESVFFRDSSSLEFSQKALSKESLNALKEQFGEESVYKREDGVYVLSAEAEKFVSGWSKALDTANEKSQTNASLDELIQKDKDFSSHLDESELSSNTSSLTTTTTIVEQTTRISVLVIRLFDMSGSDFSSLQEAMNARFNNLDIFARNFISENLESLFENKNESTKEQSSNAEDKSSNEDKTKEFANSFENSFMKISQYFTNSSLSSSSFASLSSVVFDMAQTLHNQSLANANLKQDSLASSNQSELKA